MEVIGTFVYRLATSKETRIGAFSTFTSLIRSTRLMVFFTKYLGVKFVFDPNHLLRDLHKLYVGAAMTKL